LSGGIQVSMGWIFTLMLLFKPVATIMQKQESLDNKVILK
jgi:hypothetical protein